MTERVTAYIGLGSNLGDRERSIQDALAALSSNGSVEVTRVSEIKETAPLGEMAQPKYLNGVAEIQTALEPQELLRRLKATEAALGRRPHGKWKPRPIDLDLLLFGERVIEQGGLTVPHPEMHLRSFVLDGLCQLNPDLVHPLLQEPMSELAQRLGGGDFVLDPQAPQLISVAGIIGSGKTTLAKKLAEVLPGEVLFEPYNTNPFLPQVYAGKQELALDSQLYFLVHRAGQLDRRTLPRDRVFITDYVFDKELIYARRLLDPEQLRLYESVYPPFAERVARPVLVVYLQDSPQGCLQRIHQRNRPYEQQITIEFLEGLDHDYRRLFAGWTDCPVIRVPTARLTGYNDAVVEHLIRQVRAYLPAGAGSAK
jgi:2-amino-4-hydroxy-6-hydroxymethyldihydropteridine diphosphokinase